MSEMAMKYEDWLRGCVHHDGRKGNVYLPCDTVLAIADWIEAHRDVVPVVRCKDCRHWCEMQNLTGACLRHSVIDGSWWTGTDSTDYCSFAERKDDE